MKPLAEPYGAVDLHRRDAEVEEHRAYLDCDGDAVLFCKECAEREFDEMSA